MPRLKYVREGERKPIGWYWSFLPWTRFRFGYGHIDFRPSGTPCREWYLVLGWFALSWGWVGEHAED